MILGGIILYYRRSMTTLGKVGLIIASIFSFGMIWLSYLNSYGIFEWAFTDYVNETEDKKKQMTSFGKFSLAFYWIFGALAILIIRALITWLIDFIGDQVRPADLATEPTLNFILRFFENNLSLVLILIAISLIGSFFANYGLIHLGIKIGLDSSHVLSSKAKLLLVIGTIITVGTCWLSFLVQAGKFEWSAKHFHRELGGRDMFSSALVPVAVVLIIITLVIDLITDGFSAIFSTIIGLWGFYGMVEYGLLKLTNDRLDIFPDFKLQDEQAEAKRKEEESRTLYNYYGD